MKIDHSFNIIVAKIIFNQMLIFRNWYSYGSNRYVVFLSVIIFIPLFLFIINIVNTTFETIFAKNILLIFVSVYATHFYLKLTLKENNFILSFISKSKLFRVKQIQSLLSNLIIFTLLQLFSYFANVNLLSSFLVTLTSILILLAISAIQPLLIKKKIFVGKTFSSNKFWNSAIKKKEVLPLRAIFLRELFFLFRQNKNVIIKYILVFAIINFFSVLFIINNNKEDFFVWAILLQYLFLVSFILTYSTKNNVKLLDVSKCYSSSILIGEFIFWSIIFLFHLVITTMLYFLFLEKIQFVQLMIMFVTVLILLAYTLLIRLDYRENEPTRLLLFAIIFIPITIPFTIFNSLRKLKC